LACGCGHTIIWIDELDQLTEPHRVASLDYKG